MSDPNPRDLELGSPPEDEVRAALRVLEKLVEDRARLAAYGDELTRALVLAAGRLARPERHEMKRLGKELRRRRLTDLRERDRAIVARTELRVQRESNVYQPRWLPLPSADDAQQTEPADVLESARTCYVCKAPYTTVHRFYDSMCVECGDFNYQKRLQTADLRGRTALITGARVKIGYQASLLLLRAGARVIATTRFPVDAASRYAAEPDYDEWSARLCLHGLDLRHAPSVELFARYLDRTESRLDYLVSNACQTVRRPPEWYAHLLPREEAPHAELPPRWLGPLAAGAALRRELAGAGARAEGLATLDATPGAGLCHSARLSQRRYLDEDFKADASLFPLGRYDQDLQQVDLRATNSWRLTLAQVETPELLEVYLVNAVAPFILASKLKPLMLRTRTFDQHIVNVSAMEGQFYRTTKTDKHPHTNMAKAALNMMTRTSASDYVRDGIHMNAVDTGWITDEDPVAHAARKAELGFAPPLDILDGAARIIDPIFHSANTGEHMWGQFLKDYKPARW